MKRSIERLIFLISLLTLLISACTLPSDDEGLIASPTDPSNPPTQPDTSIDMPVSQWETLALGLERRTYTSDNNSFGELIALRIDPTHYTFRAHYQAGDPLSLSSWRDNLTGAVAMINANFFDPDYNVLGLLVADGVTYGFPYTDRGGWLSVQNGQVSVRSNTVQPYQGEQVEQMVQAFPMLVLNGESIFTNGQGDRPTRRTVIAQDTQGRIIVMVTPSLGMTLVDLSAYLPTTDMNIVNAFNLDGGGSTMMFINAGSTSYTLHSFDAVPAVLAVYPR